MPIESLVGEELIIDVSDPWELTAPPGLPGRSARVVGERAGGATLTGDALLLELVAPIPYRGAVYHAAVAKPRQSESLVSCLLAGGSCEASVYGIPAADPPEDPLSATWWRGGLAMNAVLTLAHRGG